MANSSPESVAEVTSPDFAHLCARGLRAVTSAALEFTPQFGRSPTSPPPDLGQASKKKRKDLDQLRYPTATSHALLALLDSGVRMIEDFEPSVHRCSIEDPTKSLIPIIGCSEVYHYGHYLDAFLSTRAPGRDKPKWPKGADPHDSVAEIVSQVRATATDSKGELEGQLGDSPFADWAISLALRSSHTSAHDEPSVGRDSTRELIIYGHLMPAVLFLCRELFPFSSGTISAAVLKESTRFRPCCLHALLGGALWMLRRTLRLLKHSGTDADYERQVYGTELARHFVRPPPPEDELPELSAYLALNAAFALDACVKMCAWFESPELSTKDISNASAAAEDLLVLFRRLVNRSMARNTIPDDPSFDVVTLALALRGASFLEPSYRRTPIFRAGLQTVVDHQLADGCWPDGVAGMVTVRGDAVQQPSTEIALHVALAAFSRNILTQPSSLDSRLCEIVLPALRRHGRYLDITWIPHARRNPEWSGWASDRVRSANEPETWISSLATRFSHFSHLIERAAARSVILQRYETNLPIAGEYRAPEEFEQRVDQWFKKQTEPDGESQPIQWIYQQVLKPIAGKARDGRYRVKAAKSGVSFILFGPPGSGKTFLLGGIADALGWPLVSLSPQDFIKEGSEAIEAAAARIFRDLLDLEQAVVLLDECDEFFRTRSRSSDSARNVMSFVTASMLPKLQRLHDHRQIVFCLATNYLATIDRAVRRSGRFDAILLFDRPDSEARRRFIAEHWRRSQPALGIVQELADATAGASFSELVALVDTASARSKLAVADVAALAKAHLVSRDDYVDWASSDGLIDLWNAGGPLFTDNDLKRRIVTRWRQLPEFSPQSVGHETALSPQLAFAQIMGVQAEPNAGGGEAII